MRASAFTSSVVRIVSRMTDTRRKPVHHRADGNRQPDDSGPSAAERRKIVDQLAELDAVRPGRITHERTGRADGIDHHAGRSRRRGSGGCDTGARQRRRRSQVRRRILADRWRRGQARHQDDGRTPLRAFVAGDAQASGPSAARAAARPSGRAMAGTGRRRRRPRDRTAPGRSTAAGGRRRRRHTGRAARQGVVRAARQPGPAATCSATSTPAGTARGPGSRRHGAGRAEAA